jgi:hypothetical protein
MHMSKHDRVIPLKLGIDYIYVRLQSGIQIQYIAVVTLCDRIKDAYSSHPFVKLGGVTLSSEN